MKKLIFVFIVILAIVLIVGCNERRQSEPEFSSGDTTTVVTTEEEENLEPLKVTATTNPATAGALAVTSANPLETSVLYNVVRGTAPAGTHAVEVNGYKLRKFSPGQTRWTYLAATYLNTLKEGQNDYTVRALDVDGSAIATTSFSIVYNPVTPEVLPGTGTSWLIPWFITAILTLFFFRRRIFIE